MDELTRLLKQALDSYLTIRTEAALEPQEDYLPYDFYHWDLQTVGGGIVKNQLNELTNNLNGWKGALQRWHAWNLALEAYPDLHQAWDIRREFLEPLAHQCLFEPSAIRDQFTYVATQSIHQLRLKHEQAYEDRLEGDPTPAKPRPAPMKRSSKEQRLQNLLGPWPAPAERFMAALRLMDTQAYRSATHDYRNRASHAIAPRFVLGHVESVTRGVQQAKRRVQNAQGTWDYVDEPGQMQVWYSHGGTPPLDAEKARQDNLQQFLLARACYLRYRELLIAAAVEPTQKSAAPGDPA